MKEKLFVLLIVFVTATSVLTAQSLTLRETVYNSFFKGRNSGLHPQGIMNFFHHRPENKRSILFSILISTNESGIIDSISYTKGAYMIDSVITLSAIEEYLKADGAAAFAQYRNTYIIAPVWVKDIQGTTLLVSADLLASYDDLIPAYSAKARNAKKVIVLKTIRITPGEPIP